MYNFLEMVEFLRQKTEIHIPIKVNKKTFAVPGIIICVERKGTCVVWMTDSVNTATVRFRNVFLHREDCKQNHNKVKNFKFF